MNERQFTAGDTFDAGNGTFDSHCIHLLDGKGNIIQNNKIEVYGDKELRDLIVILLQKHYNNLESESRVIQTQQNIIEAQKEARDIQEANIARMREKITELQFQIDDMMPAKRKFDIIESIMDSDIGE